MAYQSRSHWNEIEAHRADPRKRFSRRGFNRTAACAAVGTVALGSTVMDLRMINAASAATTPTDYKALVCIFLYGGNDGHNMIVPTDSSTYSGYSSARGPLAIPSSLLLPVSLAASDGHTYGFHPSCPELQTLFNNGKLGVLFNVGTLIAPVTRAQATAGVGVPGNLFSHNDQQSFWQTSISDRPVSTGWGGRAADLLKSLNGNAQVSMNITLAGTNQFEIGNVVSQYSVLPTGSVGLVNVSSTQVQSVLDVMGNTRTNLLEQEYAKITTRAINNNTLISGALNSAARSTAPRRSTPSSPAPRSAGSWR
jgi:uncharacterized protein (DUF1501 family)